PGSPNGLILASAPAATADDYFIPAISRTALGDYLPSFSVGNEAGKKQWVLNAENARFTLKHDWQLDGDTNFTGLMELNNGVNITLSSAGAGWAPHTLNPGKLSSGGNSFSLYTARDADAAGRYRGDQINVAGE
ncbi:hypothetical protein BRR55_25980, partial [Salmonella enterica]|nr:hypothetical protein [Salmonella enterica]